MKWVTTGETNQSMPDVSIGDSERRMGETKEDAAISENSSVLPIIPQKVNQVTVAPLPEQVMLSGMPQQNIVILTPHPTGMPGMLPPEVQPLTPPPEVQPLTPPPEVQPEWPISWNPELRHGIHPVPRPDQEDIFGSQFHIYEVEPDSSSSKVEPIRSSSVTREGSSPISENQSPIQESFHPEPINSLWISLSLTMRNDTEKLTIERRWNITPTPRVFLMDTSGATQE
jgi:hypothetical protein